MKAKYKIPYTLDSHFGDVKTQIKNGEGKGPDHYFSVRGLLTAIAAAGVYMFMIINKNSYLGTVLKQGNLIGSAMFTIGYAGIMYVCLHEISIPQQYGFNTIEPLLRYIGMSNNRKIKTNSFSPYRNGVQMTGITGTTEQGFLKFKDNTFGVLYQVIGSASYNAFKVDKERTIDGFQTFLRTLSPNTTYTFLTNTGGQNTDLQLNHLFDELNTETDDNMIDYIAEEIRELGGYVAKDFVSLHQYMILRSPSITALNEVINTTKIFIEQDGLVLSYIERPTAEDEEAILKKVYGGLEFKVNKQWQKFEKEDKGRKSEAQTAGSLEHKAPSSSFKIAN